MLIKSHSRLNFSLLLTKPSQHGATLIISLILLMIMSMIGLASMRSTTMEEKMAGNMRDQSVAFQAAETALRAGEIFLGNPVLPAFSGNGYYQPANGTDHPVWQTVDWLSANDVVTPSHLPLANVYAPPVYIIEELSKVVDNSGSLEAGLPKTSTYYRITARAVGTTAVSKVMLQSVFKR